MPIDDAAVDGVLLECSVSVVDDPDAALAECWRVLKPGGHLVLSDVFARAAPSDLSGGCLGRVEPAEAILERLARARFVQAVFEDLSREVAAAWGQAVLEGALRGGSSAARATAATWRAARCGYCLILARKDTP